MSQDELEHLKRKVEELEKKIESIVYVTNLTNKMYMSLFERMLNLLEKLPENIVTEVANVAVEQLRKDLRETAEKLENVRKNSYVS